MQTHLGWDAGAGLYSQVLLGFKKGCPTKPYATMPKGIMGNKVHGP